MKKQLSNLIFIVLIAVVLIGCQNDGNIEENTETNNNSNTEADVKTETDTGEAIHPIVTMTMADGGEVTIELMPEIAPNTVNNFISLAEDGFYDGLIFHRVIPGFMVQGGDPSGNGTGGPGYSIAGEFKSNEFDNNLTHERNVISMARSQHPDSAGSQFFIVVEDSSHLDGEYAAFGIVTSGMDVVDSIVASERDQSDKPLEDQVIEKMEVDLAGYEAKEPEKITQ